MKSTSRRRCKQRSFAFLSPPNFIGRLSGTGSSVIAPERSSNCVSSAPSYRGSFSIVRYWTLWSFHVITQCQSVAVSGWLVVFVWVYVCKPVHYILANHVPHAILHSFVEGKEDLRFQQTSGFIDTV